MDFLELCKTRYSVRRFSQRAVEEDKLRRILEAGRLAPTAKNCQSQRIFVLRSEEALSKVRGATPMVFDAPVVLMVCYDEEESYKNTADTHFVGYDGGEVDAAIVTSAMMMEATELALGTLWARGFDSQRLYDAFPQIANLHLVCLLDIGYPAEGCTPSERHEQRKPLEQTVSWL